MLDNADNLDNIIETLKDLDRLKTKVSIICPAKNYLLQLRDTRRTAQLGEEALVWSLTGETRRPEHVPQPVQRPIHPH